MIQFDNLVEIKETRIYGGTDTFNLWFTNNGMLYVETFLLILSCHFDFKNFPFDSHKCCVNYGQQKDDAGKCVMNTTIIYFSKKSTVDLPILEKNLPFPFEFQIESVQTFNESDVLTRRSSCADNFEFEAFPDSFYLFC